MGRPVDRPVRPYRSAMPVPLLAAAAATVVAAVVILAAAAVVTTIAADPDQNNDHDDPPPVILAPEIVRRTHKSFPPMKDFTSSYGTGTGLVTLSQRIISALTPSRCSPVTRTESG